MIHTDNSIIDQSSLYAHLDDIDWNFPHSNNGHSLHSIHPYPAKFIPEIPRGLIKILDVDDNTSVLDPFCGSGVTLTEAISAGHSSIGVDLNPIACLISKVKTNPFNDDLNEYANHVMHTVNNYHMSPRHSSIQNLDHWFDPYISLRLSQIIQSIDALNASTNITNALKLAFSSIIVKVSRQESDTRYAAVENTYTTTDVMSFFSKACKKINKHMHSSLNSESECRVINKNILETTPEDINATVGLTITSPPYPAAYEYWLYHKYRMFWLGYDPIYVREKEIGARPHYFKKNPPTPSDFQEQMAHIMWLTREVSSNSSHVCFVVGPSKIRGEIIDNSALVISAGNEYGWKLESHISRSIKASNKSFNLNHARISDESILIFSRGTSDV